jgi:hypothetical protein
VPLDFDELSRVSAQAMGTKMAMGNDETKPIEANGKPVRPLRNADFAPRRASRVTKRSQRDSTKTDKEIER